MALKDLKYFQDDMETCSRCFHCKFINLEKVENQKYSQQCPSNVYFKWNTYSAFGRISWGLGLVHGDIELTPRVAEVAYNCNLCGGCDVSCKYTMDMEVLEPLYAERAECVKAGQTNPVLDKLVEGMKKGAPMVSCASGKKDWAKGLKVADYTTEKVPVIFHAGCMANYDDASAKAANAALSLLLKAGVKAGIAKDELCCGSLAYEAGYQDDAVEQAKKNVARFKESGATEIVTACSHCYQAFKVLYDKFELDLGLKVYHITEYLAQLIADGKLKLTKPVNMTVTYHDPCHLGRLSEPWIHWEGKLREKHIRVFDPPKTYRRGTYGSYDAVREVLKSIPGLQLVEMNRNKEVAFCCGGGGGVPDTNPEFAQWTANYRLDEAAATGAQALVTACPHCVKNFAAADTQGLKIYDIVELVDMAI
ncbi:MAG: (Fe-S)-binding protein [Thermoleophilia bacterium]|jgi:Fe-S oxidoreductase